MYGLGSMGRFYFPDALLLIKLRIWLGVLSEKGLSVY